MVIVRSKGIVTNSVFELERDCYTEYLSELN